MRIIVHNNHSLYYVYLSWCPQGPEKGRQEEHLSVQPINLQIKTSIQILSAPHEI